MTAGTLMTGEELLHPGSRSHRRLAPAHPTTVRRRASQQHPSSTKAWMDRCLSAKQRVATMITNGSNAHRQAVSLAMQIIDRARQLGCLPLMKDLEGTLWVRGCMTRDDFRHIARHVLSYLREPDNLPGKAPESRQVMPIVSNAKETPEEMNARLAALGQIRAVARLRQEGHLTDPAITLAVLEAHRRARMTPSQA